MFLEHYVKNAENCFFWKQLECMFLIISLILSQELCK